MPPPADPCHKTIPPRPRGVKFVSALQWLYIFLAAAIMTFGTCCERPKDAVVIPPQPVTRSTDMKNMRTEEAIFAGGCFWGVEHWFRQVPGVVSVTSGYTDGTLSNPTYEDVCSDLTGHAEAVRVIFDPARVPYEKLARLFFEIHDPTTLNSQGPDFGAQYRSVVFYKSPEQKAVVEKLIGLLRDNRYNVVTQVVPASTFYPAEEYHQDYLNKHPGRQDCHIRVPRFDVRKP